MVLGGGHFLMSEVTLYLVCLAGDRCAGDWVPRKVDVRLLEKGDSKSHVARSAHLIIATIKWIRTSKSSIKKSLSQGNGWSETNHSA